METLDLNSASVADVHTRNYSPTLSLDINVGFEPHDNPVDDLRLMQTSSIKTYLLSNLVDTRQHPRLSGHMQWV